MLKRIKPYVPKKLRSFGKKALQSKLAISLFKNANSENLRTLAVLYGTDKWGVHWYMEHYETHFRPFRNKRIKLLEIGVGGYDNPENGGHSLRVWKQYFRSAQIFSFDIHDKSRLQEDRIRIFQGSQVDSNFLQSLLIETGELDIIIDDGSHIVNHIIETFKLLFPHLKNGGLYVIEDLHTSYHDEFGGDRKDLDNPKTSMNFLKSLTDCLNYQEYLGVGEEPSYFDKHISSIHFYHNLVFIYKGLNDEMPSNRH
ncbi:class I SAM-dependent methyltransferase [Flavisolibacter nicotianae]|uniref:class I SAM-dependent methyltransferase n=1 Tax=Flavisolibacter nicotianae TaxID=2364882 RepID=UPI000EAE5F4A|nr:class I SAM-dependent methyltransferase [Flavisolibacter nicotianae]